MNPAGTTGNRRRRHAAFTLVELIVSSAAAAVLLGGLAAAVMIASRTLPTRADRATTLLAGRDAAEAMLNELNCATQVLEATPTSVTVMVPDRTGDGVDDKLAFAWGGTAGNPITRTFNTNTAANLVEGVQRFALQWESVERSAVDGRATTGTCIRDATPRGSTLEYRIDDSSWVAVAFVPDLPADALTFRITDLHFDAHYYGSAVGLAEVRIYNARADGSPTGSALAATLLPEAALPEETGEIVMQIEGAPALSAGTRVAIVFANVGKLTGAVLQGATDAASSYVLTTSNQGGNWSAQAGQSLRYEVFAEVVTSSGALPATRLASSLAIELQLDTEPGNVARASLPLLNTPELP